MLPRVPAPTERGPDVEPDPHNGPMMTARNQVLDLRVGHLTRGALRDALAARGVRCNVHARTLLEHAVFDEPAPAAVRLAVRTVGALGLGAGGTLPQILAAAVAHGLRPCRPQLGPYLRLADPVEEPGIGPVEAVGRAPGGSITVASRPLARDHDVPKGFYLRTVEGQLWLRGYRCDDEHVFAPDAVVALEVRSPW